jgi:hypothetical protein
MKLNNLPSCALLEHLNVKEQKEEFKARCPFFRAETHKRSFSYSGVSLHKETGTK